jgi:tetratricopeptide (TPR) repeat protein
MGSTRSRFFASAALVSACFCSGAVATERGGVESPFASGVGARALALGGAYTALAEGPTALAWNPAGIAFGERKELAFFYTSPFVEGNRLTFLGYMHPFLGFGTVGFGNSRYGVDGIEKYDGDGSALGTFSSVQNEWTFAYALPPIGPLSIGAGLKAETHAMDGHTATGIGADLGAIVRPEGSGESAFSYRNLAFGAAIQNAIQPTLALAEGDDRIPVLLRLGAAYGIPLGRAPGEEIVLLAGFDRGSGTGGRVRLGAEYALADGLTLRFGISNEEWSGGFGVAVGGGRLDYAYGSMDLGSVHRLGLTLSFGESLGEVFEARRNEEARALDERTAEELRTKEESQVRTHLDEGAQRLARGEYAEAEAAFERALLWEPGNEEADAGLRGARVGKHIEAGDARRGSGDLLEALAEYRAALAIDPGHERVRTLASETTDLLDRSEARSREMSEHLARGIELLALSSFSKARAEFEQALTVDPENADALRYKARTDSLVALRVDALVEEGDYLRDRGNPEAAVERYREALSLRPDRDDLAREITRLRAPAAQEAPVAAAAAETPRPAPRRLSPDETREAERMYRSGLDAFKEGRNDEAIRYFEFVYGLSPAYENVGSYLKQAHLFSGMDLYTAGRLDEAVRSWERILEMDPDDEKALSYVQRARAEMRKTQDLSGGTP